VVAAAFTGPWLVWGSRLAQAHGLTDWHLPQGVALWSMTLPVLLTAAACWGRFFVRDLGHRLLAWRVSARAYGYALGSPVAVAAIAVGVTKATGHRVATGVVLSLPSALGFLAFETLLDLLTEELMWRGVLLPRVRTRMGVGRAGLTVGAVWAVWHIPLLSVPGETARGLPLPGFLVLATSVVMACLMELCGYSVLVAAAFHAALNATYSYAGIVGGSAVTFWAAAVVTVLAAAALLARDRRSEPTQSPTGSWVFRAGQEREPSLAD
jgi:membrane protease YdiL (CAAX protease family)